MLLLAFSLWLQDIFTSKPELLTRDKTRFANYFLEDFKLTAYNKSGKPKYTIKAQRLDHFEQESLAEIQQINAEIYNKESNWTITANKARLYQDENKMEFFDDVKIFRPKHAEQAEFSFQSKQMTLFSEKEILQTNHHVTVNSNGTLIKSKGLRYDGKQGILELKADVKVTYVK